VNDAYILSAYEKAGVHLERKGNRWVALCPFHNETKPSFTVFSDNGSFKCFGCGARGTLYDIIDDDEQLLLLKIDIESASDKSYSRIDSFINLLETRLLNISRKRDFKKRMLSFDMFDKIKICSRYNDKEGLIERLLWVKRKFELTVKELGERNG